jgi:hypothetical protein
MTKNVLIAALALGLLSFSAPAWAHHSAAQFDFSVRDIKWTGTVKEFKAANPHSRIVLEVSDAKGTRDVQFQAHSLNNIYRNGWRPGMVKVGDKVTLITSPPKGGGDGGYVLTLVTAEGQKF